MNTSCQPIPTANVSPKYRRFDSNHRVPWFGQSVARDDAVKANQKKGSAQRTECRIKESSPSMVSKSENGSAATVETFNASARTQKKRQWLMSLFIQAPGYRYSVLVLHRVVLADSALCLELIKTSALQAKGGSSHDT